MEILVDRKLILTKFLIPLNKFTDQAIITLTRDCIDCVSYTTNDKQTIVLYTKLVVKNKTDDPNFVDVKLNIGSVKKFINALSCLSDDIIALDIQPNHIAYTSPNANFKFHLKEDGTIESAPMSVTKINNIEFSTEVTISNDTLKEVIKASGFSIDTNKIYFNMKDGSLYGDLTDKTIQNLDNINILISENVVGDKLESPVILGMDVFKVLSSTKCKQLDIKFSKNGAVVFHIKEDNYLMKYLTSSLVK
jgi:hypothetical protein